LPHGADSYPLKASPPPASARARVGGKLDLGVRALNAFVTCCKGQRMGIFSGSGVGKSTVLAMLARNSIEASFLEPIEKRRWAAAIDAYVARY